MLESVLAQSEWTYFWKSMTKQDLVNNMCISLLVIGVLKPGRWQGGSTGEMLLLWLTFGYQVRRRLRRRTWPCPSISQLVSDALDQWFWQTLGSKEVPCQLGEGWSPQRFYERKGVLAGCTLWHPDRWYGFLFVSYSLSLEKYFSEVFTGTRNANRCFVKHIVKICIYDVSNYV